MYFCSAKVALTVLLGPLAVCVVLLALRKALASWVRKLTARLPEAVRFLPAPLLAALLFGVVWAGAHAQTSDSQGLVSQKTFPALVGLFTYATMRYGRGLQKLLAGLFDLRDRLPRAMRWAALLGAPILLSLLLTAQERVTETALKEQVVVLFSLVLAYVLMTPRGGAMADMLRKGRGGR